MKKRADFNFTWLFAIIAGSAILILMIYAAVRTGRTMTFYEDTDLAKQMSVFLDPFQAGFVSSVKGTISSKREIVFESLCDSTNFGYQTLAAKQIRDLNENFNVLGDEIKIKNKYVYFSNEPSKKFYVFSVPITFAFKIADVLIIDSREFCFLDGYEKIPSFKGMVSVLGEKALFGEENCTENSVRVCFDSGNDCDIEILGDCKEDCDTSYDFGRVIKSGETFEYAGELLYPAIFSEKEIYDCNLRRILYKNGMLSLIYSQKEDIMSSRGCQAGLGEELAFFSQLSFSQNSDIKEIYRIGKILGEREERTYCKLWS